MPHTPSIAILLSVYDGESYLHEQIKSLLNQSFENWHLYIRDDSSQDSSLEIINSFTKQFPDKISILNQVDGKLGASGSFASMMELPSSDYLMFCDQDDVWLPDKIQKTYERMQEYEKKHGRDTPILIHTDLKVVDSSLGCIADSFWAYQNIHPQGRESLNRLLPQNVVSGCTIMVNACLRELALPIPQEAIMHDWWLALVAAAFGVVGHVEESTILYRQHLRNEVGARNWHHIRSRIKDAFDKERAKASLENTFLQAGAFLDCFAEKLSLNQQQIVDSYASLPQQSKMTKLYSILKYRYVKAGFLRTFGMLFRI